MTTPIGQIGLCNVSLVAARRGLTKLWIGLPSSSRNQPAKPISDSLNSLSWRGVQAPAFALHRRVPAVIMELAERRACAALGRAARAHRKVPRGRDDEDGSRRYLALSPAMVAVYGCRKIGRVA